MNNEYGKKWKEALMDNFKLPPRYSGSVQKLEMCLFAFKWLPSLLASSAERCQKLRCLV